MKTSIVLRRALARIKKGWCKGTFAKTKDGRAINCLSKEAVKFCSSGAISRESYPNEITRLQARFLLKDVIEGDAHTIWNDGSITLWNDDPKRTKRQVIVAFQKAIKLAEKEEKK